MYLYAYYRAQVYTHGKYGRYNKIMVNKYTNIYLTSHLNIHKTRVASA